MQKEYIEFTGRFKAMQKDFASTTFTVFRCSTGKYAGTANLYTYEDTAFKDRYRKEEFKMHFAPDMYFSSTDLMALMALVGILNEEIETK